MIEQLTHEFSDWLFHLSALNIYLMLFVIAYLENVLPPIPGDLFVVLAGYLAAEGIVDFWSVLSITTLGSVLGFMSVFTLGWVWGDEIKLKRSKFWLFKYVHLKYYAKVKSWMHRWGQGVILANRFLAGARTIISLTSGIAQTRVDLTLASSIISALLWNALLILIGWIIKENWDRIGSYFDIYGVIITILLMVIIAFKVFWMKRRKKAN
ncbi:MAG: DedA family protein [Balneolales bacterium]